MTKMLDGGFPVDEPLMDHSRQTMLMAACENKNCSPELVQLILRYRPHINLQDSVGRTALHLACRAGKANIVKILAEVERIDVNRRTCGGETPLMYAA